MPRKNVRLLRGKPLIAYTIEAALLAQSISRIIMSTDDPEIASVGRAYGAEVPFIRPQELARDETPMLPVVRHAVSFLEEQGDRYDAVCLLQPTNPLRNDTLINHCIEVFYESGAETLVTVLQVPTEYNPHWVYFKRDDGTLYLSTGEKSPVVRRQDLPQAYHREGSVYVTGRDILMTQNSLYGERLIGFQVSPDRCVNIDTIEDWERAETLLSADKRVN